MTIHNCSRCGGAMFSSGEFVFKEIGKIFDI